jgi:hypothetical protein
MPEIYCKRHMAAHVPDSRACDSAEIVNLRVQLAAIAEERDRLRTAITGWQEERQSWYAGYVRDARRIDRLRRAFARAKLRMRTAEQRVEHLPAMKEQEDAIPIVLIPIVLIPIVLSAGEGGINA